MPETFWNSRTRWLLGDGAHTVGIGDEQGVGGERQSAGRSQNRVAGIGVLGGEGGLPDHQPRGLSGGKVGARKRTPRKNRNIEMHFMRNVFDVNVWI